MKIFIGYDHDEEIAYHVLSSSIIRYASEPPKIIPVKRSQVKAYSRPRGPYDSTEFSNSRFMVPYLCNYEGFAIFMDCDMVFKDDIVKLWKQKDVTKWVQVVKHDYVPKSERKFLNQEQTKYARKNWSSLIIFNCSKCKELSPAYVNSANGLDLHQFKWCPDDKIGGINEEWNWLVGEYLHNPEAKNLHYTLGGPWFGYKEEQDAWNDEYNYMIYRKGDIYAS